MRIIILFLFFIASINAQIKLSIYSGTGNNETGLKHMLTDYSVQDRLIHIPLGLQVSAGNKTIRIGSEVNYSAYSKNQDIKNNYLTYATIKTDQTYLSLFLKLQNYDHIFTTYAKFNFGINFTSLDIKFNPNYEKKINKKDFDFKIKNMLQLSVAFGFDLKISRSNLFFLELIYSAKRGEDINENSEYLLKNLSFHSGCRFLF